MAALIPEPEPEPDVGPAPGAEPQPADSSLLALLGLDAEQDALYQRLVDRPGSDPAVLTPPTAEVEAVTRTLRTLVDRGLATAERHPEGARYRASSPLLALGPLLESRRADLHRVEHFVTELAGRHRAAQSRTPGAPVEVLSGASAIRRWLVVMQRQARHEVLSLVPALRAPAAVMSFEDNLEEVELESMRRGVTMRSVVERAWLEDPGLARSFAELAGQGQQISVTDELPVKLIIADRDVALLPLDETSGPVALVVHRSGLLTALVSLFEQYFAKGWRLRATGAEQGQETDAGLADGRDTVDRQIVALLHVGLTDAAIARQLGMGHRTVQRRLQVLMASVGAVTRFQLGWHAAAAGSLDADAARPGAPPPTARGTSCCAPPAAARPMRST
ncbi:helix-turn-helix transcriptional regulator [Peterkaempfera sp. SMS 1(5)a]|uniref:helix-turn-helix transcriptional regulator n=1 Tax=Peterkaempfera podocarpi TaxID=3232308 RepID=UPI00366ABC2C